MRHIVQPNKNFSFDFFIHCWSTDLEKQLVELYKPVAYQFENNIQYKGEFEEFIVMKKAA